jgi:Tfp pilus assembly protein PilO
MRRSAVVLKRGKGGLPSNFTYADGTIKNQNDWLLKPMIVICATVAGSILGLSWFMSSESQRIQQENHRGKGGDAEHKGH